MADYAHDLMADVAIKIWDNRNFSKPLKKSPNQSLLLSNAGQNPPDTAPSILPPKC